MKNLVEFINERANSVKYIIKYKVKGSQEKEIFSNNWKADIPDNAESFEVFNASYSNLSEPDGLIAWKNSYYWLSQIENSKLRPSQIEKIERTQIKESLNESKDEKWFRFIVKEFGDKDIVKNIGSVAFNSKIYSEEIDGGIKIKITDANVKNAYKIVDLVKDYIDMYKDDENKSSAVENVQKTLKDLQEYIDDNTEEGE